MCALYPKRVFYICWQRNNGHCKLSGGTGYIISRFQHIKRVISVGVSVCRIKYLYCSFSPCFLRFFVQLALNVDCKNSFFPAHQRRDCNGGCFSATSSTNNQNMSVCAFGHGRIFSITLAEHNTRKVFCCFQCYRITAQLRFKAFFLSIMQKKL